MQYNTQQKRMSLPEYGRSIQNMVDYAVSTHLRDVPDFKHKLWDHLAIMSDFKLDIDYPYEIMRKERLDAKPDPIPYPHTRIRYRHYGRSLEELIEKACEMPEGEEKLQLTALICNHMKKDYMTWNKDTVDDRKIADDLAELSEGRLQVTPDILRVMDERINRYCRPVKGNYPNNNRNNNNRNNNNRNKKSGKF